MNSSLTCVLVPSEKPLEEEPMDESLPKVCELCGGPPEWRDAGWGRGEETFWGSCRRKLGWIDPLVSLGSVLSPQCHNWCVVPPSTGSELQRQQLPHSRGAQPSDSSSLEFIQHIHSPRAMYCACVQSYRDVWDILVCHKTCTVPSRGNACFLNGSKPWKSIDVFIQFCIWAIMTLPCRNLQPG